MFERYTERARRSIYYARELVSEYGSITIETEHLLLGILREDPNIIRRFLQSKTNDEIRAEVAKGNLSLERKRTLVLATKLPYHRECANDESDQGQKLSKQRNRIRLKPGCHRPSSRNNPYILTGQVWSICKDPGPALDLMPFPKNR